MVGLTGDEDSLGCRALTHFERLDRIPPLGVVGDPHPVVIISSAITVVRDDPVVVAHSPV